MQKCLKCKNKTEIFLKAHYKLWNDRKTLQFLIQDHFSIYCINEISTSSLVFYEVIDVEQIKIQLPISCFWTPLLDFLSTNKQ
jgi:hypothetical protein